MSATGNKQENDCHHQGEKRDFVKPQAHDYPISKRTGIF
jgi:hypothetical protein